MFFLPDGRARITGAPKLPITITLFTDMTTNPFIRLRLLPVIAQSGLRLAFITAQFFPRGSLTTELESRTQISRRVSGAGGWTCTGSS